MNGVSIADLDPELAAGQIEGGGRRVASNAARNFRLATVTVLRC